MTDDRAAFATNRDAGLVKRHEQRLARAREGIEFPAAGVERTAYLEGEPVTDMVIPPAAIEAAAQALFVDQDGPFVQPNHPNPWMTTFEESRRPKYTRRAAVALEAALPHLRPMLELAGNLGRELGRREAAEELATAFDREIELIESLPDDAEVRPQVRDVLLARRSAFRDSAHIAREIATKEPK